MTADGLFLMEVRSMQPGPIDITLMKPNFFEAGDLFAGSLPHHPDKLARHDHAVMSTRVESRRTLGKALEV